MDTIRRKPGAVGPGRTPIGRVELVEGKIGKACQFHFGANRQSDFFTAGKRPTPAWDKTHFGETGHRLTAETVFRAIQNQR